MIRNGRSRSPCLAVAAAVAIAFGCASAYGDGDIEQIYHFVDQNGVPHFTNVPVDARYKPLQLRVRNISPSVSNVYRPGTQPMSQTPAPPLPQTPDDLPEARATDPYER